MRQSLIFIIRLLRIFGMRVLEVAVRYGFTLSMAIILGVGGAGQIYLALSVIALAASLSRLGLDAGMMRALTLARQAGDAPGARGLALFGLGFTGGLGTLFSLLLVFAAPWLANHVFGAGASEAVLRALGFGALGLALLAMIGSLLIALDRPVLGQFVSAVLWPLPVLAWLWLPGADAESTAWVIAAATLAAAGLGVVLILRRLGGPRPLRWPRRLPAIRAALPLFGAELVQIMMYHLPILALGLMADDATIGRFGLASRLAVLLTVMAIAVYAITGPRFAALHAAGDRAGLTQAACAATRMVVAAALPVALLFWLAPGPVLGLLGTDFRAGAPLLVILTLGHFVNVGLSASHTLLVMTGHARELWRNSLMALLVLGLGLVLLLPLQGGLGPALASAAAYITISLANLRSVRRRLGIDLLRAFAPSGKA